MSEHPSSDFYQSLSALGRHITATYDTIKSSLSDEDRSKFGEIFDAYSSLIEAVEHPDLIIGRAIGDVELREMLNGIARRSFNKAA
jgi:hypothetical protein